MLELTGAGGYSHKPCVPTDRKQRLETPGPRLKVTKHWESKVLAPPWVPEPMAFNMASLSHGLSAFTLPEISFPAVSLHLPEEGEPDRPGLP